ncbi:hypothetical protein XANCAGTX0491_008801 [Xanthoria calcicola]
MEWLKERNVSHTKLFLSIQFLMHIVQSDQIPALFPAICVLMATEAARQMLKPIDRDKPVVRLANVKFLGNLHLSASAVENREIEIQFVSKLDDDMSRMTFEIFRASPTVNDGWQLCSTGTLELASKLPEMFEHNPDHSPHHPLLDKRARSLDPDVFDAVNNLKLGSGKISGDVPMLQQTWQEYIIHPIALGYILSLGPTALVGQNLPVKHCLSSIPMLDIEINLRPSDLLRFAIDTQSTLSGGAICEVQVLDGGHGLLAGDLQYTATATIPAMPTASSLFFKPLSLPDITKCTGIKYMSIEYCVQLLTHKWPMSDVFINVVATDVRNRILRAFNPPRPEERKSFRSMLVMGDVEESDTVGSVQYVREINRGLQAHMIFTDKVVSIDWLHEHLRPAGFICVCEIGETTANKLFKHFNYICELTDGDKITGTLWRVNSIPSNMLPKKRRIVFCNGNFELNNSLQITLAPKEIQAFTSLNTSDGRFDAILIDDPEKSIITTWPGNDLIPWLQHLMEQANSLLWVTLDASSSPFVDIAGTLLRTLQAEQPSLKVSWLCLNQRQRSEAKLVKSIEVAYASMMHGDNEVRLDWDATGIRIVRYLPDEDILAATGIALPREVHSPIGDSEYSLTLAATHESVVLSYDPAAEQQQRQLIVHGDPDDEDSDKNLFGEVKVLVEASIIDSDDVAANNGQIEIHEAALHKRSTTALGTFFAGRVLASPVADMVPDTSVIGWTQGANANIVTVPRNQLIGVEGHDLPDDLTRFASVATAMAVLEGHSRAKSSDHFRFVKMGAVLHGAFSTVCRFLEIKDIQGDHGPTFCIEVSDAGGILVNKTPVNIRRNLPSCLCLLRKFWGELKQHDWFVISKPQCFPFKCHKAAFEAALKSKDPVVLLHKNLEGMIHVPIYRPSMRLSTSQGAYIIIGGLGGLGRYTFSWLVDHGATSLYSISRSGISSPEAQSLYDSLNSKHGVRLEVIKADACNRSSITHILATIRAKEPIKGVINMAMILGDAPMASMTGKEWDRALNVKIRSSWILHEETKDDELDFFVLFSSIASVLGNRNQGSYNVGNTFLNALSTYRRRHGRTAVAVALGAMTDIGVLSAYATPTTPLMLTRSGLTHLTTSHLSKILEAAFYKSRQQLAGKETIPEDAIMVTGLEMWEENTSAAEGKEDGGNNGPVYWRSCPEFSHLATYKNSSNSSSAGKKDVALKDRIREVLATAPSAASTDDKAQNGTMAVRGLEEKRKEVRDLLTPVFLGFLSRTLGFATETFEMGTALGMYGLDSLSAVEVQYWVWRELTTSITVPEIFAAASIKDLMETIAERVLASGGKNDGG